MMKKLLMGLLLLLGAAPMGYADNGSCCNTSCAPTSNCSSDAACSCPCSGKTYFAVRPMYQSVRPELIAGFRNDRMLAAQDGWGGAFDIVVFGGRTTKGRDLANYFLPNCKNSLVVTEQTNNPAVATQAVGDLLAENFNIFTVNRGTPGQGFQSSVCFNARHTEVGVGLHWLQSFWCNDDRNKWWYLDVNFPIMNVNNRMSISENVVNNGGGVDTSVTSVTPVANMVEAFKQAAWNFGKIDCTCKRSKTGVADVELKIGYQWMWQDCCNIASYAGVLIPTGNAPTGRYVFEPIVGHGKHVGVMWGSRGGFEIWTNCDETWHLDFDLAVHSQYLFKKKQVRSFDLKGKPWSRYLEVYANFAQAQTANTNGDVILSTPGINVFTQCVSVKPGFFHNMTSSLIMENNCGFQAELGYNLYARQTECIGLNWVTGPAIKLAAITSTSGAQAGLTNPVRDITPNPLLNEPANNVTPFGQANYTLTQIQQADIDTQSAAHPAGIAYLVYGSLGKRWDDMCYPIDLNLGGSYEFSSRDFSVLNRWGVWGKFGVAF